MKMTIIKITSVAVIISMALMSCQKAAPPAEATAPFDSVKTEEPPSDNNLTAEERTAGWELLFDGKTLDGWKRYNADSIGPLWTVKDGAIVCDGKGLTEGTANIGGSLMTKKSFGNFELTADWKLSPGGNSGILYHVVENKKYKHDYETGPEVQVMDDEGWKGEKLRDVQKVGGAYDMFAAPATKKVMPVGEWNTIKLVYNNGHVEHYLNGEKVVEYDESSPAFADAKKKSKWTKYPDWNKSKTGPISLQDHGAAVYFKNIKIKAL
ncbi:MAG: DUF1080 domain-containing protein [Chryseolinea sp.]